MTHPGEEIRKALGPNSCGWLAQQLSVSRMTAWRLVHGRQRISAKIAHRLSATFEGRTAKEWKDLQTTADLENTKQEASA